MTQHIADIAPNEVRSLSNIPAFNYTFILQRQLCPVILSRTMFIPVKSCRFFSFSAYTLGRKSARHSESTISPVVPPPWFSPHYDVLREERRAEGRDVAMNRSTLLMQRKRISISLRYCNYCQSLNYQRNYCIKFLTVIYTNSFY